MKQIKPVIIIFLFIISFLTAPTVFAAAPEATNLSAAETYTEDTPLNLIDIVTSDIDSVNITATLTLSNPAAGSLNTATSGAVISTYNAGTGTWTASGTIADVNVLLAGVTFTPTANYSNNFTISTNVSDGVEGPITGSKTMTAIAVNDAPVVDSSRGPIMIPMNVNDGAPTGAVGTSVSSLIDATIPTGGLDNFTDPDSGASLGIAVIATNTNLTCSYSVNGGTTWIAVGSVSNSSARLLAANGSTRIYCYAGLGIFGTFSDAITFRAWDQTSGTNGSLTSVASNGGTSAFSSATDTVSLTIVVPGNHAPVAVDDEFTVDQNAGLTELSVLDNDTDSDSDELGISTIDDSSTTGTVLISSPPVVIGYTPVSGFCGDDEFSYTVTDNNGGTDTGIVTVHVTNCDTTTQTPTSLTLASSQNGVTFTPTELFYFTFNIPEPAAHASIVLTFIPESGTSIVIHLMDAPDNTDNPLVINPQNIASAPEVVTTTATTIPVGTYTIRLSYQDVLQNPVASVELQNIIIQNVASYGSSSGYSPAFAWTPTQVTSVSQNNSEPKKACPSDQVLTQNLRAGSRNGKYDFYTKGIVTEAKILQAHMNRLGFNAGTLDGILGIKSNAAIKKLQTYLGVKADGYIGTQTRKVINNSCTQ